MADPRHGRHELRLYRADDNAVPKRWVRFDRIAKRRHRPFAQRCTFRVLERVLSERPIYFYEPVVSREYVSAVFALDLECFRVIIYILCIRTFCSFKSDSP